MARNVIGVLPLWDESKNSIWMLPGYIDGIIRAGGCPEILPLTDNDDIIRQLAIQHDGFLFTGGQDVSPSLYKEAKSDQCGPAAELRDTMESKLFKTLLQLNKPCFGICRAIQLFNVLLGGSLYQDLNTQYSSLINHRQSLPYDAPVHRVDIASNTPLDSLFKTQSMEVNSLHHQAIKILSPSLTAMATSEDGLVEAVYMPGKKFVWAVQWHPEYFLDNAKGQKLFSAFINACNS